MTIVWLNTGALVTDDGPISAGWYVRLDDGTSYSGPFASEAEAERALDAIVRGDVDDLPIVEAWPK